MNRRNNLKRLQDEQTKLEQAKAEKLKLEQAKIEEAKKLEAAKVELPKTPEVPAAPKVVELGQLNMLATKLATPIYPPMAQQLNLQGKITVQIAIDEQGEVTSAKAINGHQFLRNAAEDAARKSKFKPTLEGTQAVKATGFIVYNFVGK